MGTESFDLSCHEISCDDTLGLTVDENHVEHLIARIALYGTCRNLTVEGSISTEKELLSGLSAGVEGTANLRTSERAVGEKSAVFPCKRNTLCDALVNDIVADLGKTVNVCLACTIVSSLDCVLEETVDRVVVVLVVLGSVDTTLCRDRVGTTR